jgi:hypothetical protein
MVWLEAAGATQEALKYRGHWSRVCRMIHKTETQMRISLPDLTEPIDLPIFNVGRRRVAVSTGSNGQPEGDCLWSLEARW